MARPTTAGSRGWAVAAAGGVLAVLVTVAVLAPAQWADHAVQTFTGGRVELGVGAGWMGSDYAGTGHRTGPR